MTEFIKEHGSEVENMLFTEFNMDVALEVRYEEGFEQGIEKGMEKGIEKGIAKGIEKGMEQGLERGKQEGEAEGRLKTLIRQVCKKLQKGKAPDIIAEELEEDEAAILQICSAAKEAAPDYDIEQIYKKLTL